MAKAYGSELLKATAVESFWNSFLAFPDPFADLVYRRNSTQSADVYTWLGSAPLPEEWVGNANVKDVNEYSDTVENKAYNSAVRVDKRLIKYQQWDEISNMLSNMGAKARAHQASLMSALLEAGFTTGGESYDGQFFFDDDHVDVGAEYTTNQDNDLTANITTTADPSASQFATAVRAIIDAFYGFKDDRGEPFVPSTDIASPQTLCIMVPPTYATVARQVLTADTLAAAGDNDLKGAYELRINPWFTNTDRFYGFVKNVSHKPIILQETGGLMLDDNMGADEYVLSGDVIYTASWWGRVFYGQWRTAVSYIYT